MQQPPRESSGDRLGQEDGEVRAAVRFAALTTVGAVGVLVVAAMWVSTCGDPSALDTVGCGLPERTLLSAAAPIVLLAGGLRAFLRTYRVWRDRGIWWAWQGAGWFLLTLMAVVLTMSVPPMIVPVLGH